MRRIRLYALIAISALAALASVAPAHAGINIGNHNETFLRDHA